MRNRERVLDAVRPMLETRSLDEISTDEIAAAAGVGKGTVFRAFGDKAGLASALVDAAERRLQEAVLRGPSPLGPGGEPLDRVVAFVRAYAAFMERNVDLLLVVDGGSPTGRYRSGAYGGWHALLRSVLSGRAQPGDPDADAHAILALLDPALYRRLRRDLGYGTTRCAQMMERAAAAITLATPTRGISSAG